MNPHDGTIMEWKNEMKGEMDADARIEESMVMGGSQRRVRNANEDRHFGEEEKPNEFAEHRECGILRGIRGESANVRLFR